MKFIIALIFALTTSFALAAQPPLIAQDLISNNILVNPGFENGKYGWTASGGATATANATAVGLGTYGYDWNSNGAAQTLISNAVTIPNGLLSKQGVAFCKIKAVSGTPTHTITVNDGSNDLVTAQTIATSTSEFTRNSVYFKFPSSGSVKIKIASVAADEPEIYIDDCFIGDAFDIVNVSQAQFIGSAYFAPTTNCTFTRTSATLGAMSDTDCPGPTVETNPGPGTIQTTDVNAPNVTVNNLPPGIYEVTFSGQAAAQGGVAGLAINDGTNTRGQVGGVNDTVAFNNFVVTAYFEYTTTANRTFSLYAANTTNDVNIGNSTGTAQTVFHIKRYPSLGEQAVRIESINWRVDATIAGANPSLGTVDVASYTGIESGSLTLTNNTGSGVLAAQIPCSSTNPPTGTTCSAGNESLGVSFVLPAAGDVIACASASWFMSAAGVITGALQVVETPANAQTISQEGKSRIAAQINNAILAYPMRVCGTFTFTSAGQKTLRLMYEQDVNGTITSSLILADASSVEGQRDVHWEVYPISQRMPAPYLIGAVTSGSSGTERIERAILACGAASSITSQSGTWLASVGNRSSTACAITITTGIFSAKPTCFFVMSSTRQATAVDMASATAGTLYGDSVDYAGQLLCMGPR